MRNISGDLGENDISKAYAIPEGIHQTLTQKCYDCHSNHTRYPWYFNVQPIGWWLAAHVYEGKSHLIFSEFRSYQADQAQRKLEDIIEMVKERAMPLKGYVPTQRSPQKMNKPSMPGSVRSCGPKINCIAQTLGREQNLRCT